MREPLALRKTGPETGPETGPRERLLSGVHEAGFTDLIPARLNVLQYPGPIIAARRSSPPGPA
jgi:hypothetical protein